ncbi:MAG: sulfite exporter TauE/SafE family protein [Hyphomicrobiaceae bacterium]|nr:sulfite exporter TauE/SafE family protein [Hyphomicrobiaceae bacterium]
MDILSFVALAGVAFFAATVQAATGFGFAIMAVPFFLLIMGSLTAIQVTAVINFVISLVLMRRLLDGAPYRLLAHLMIGSVLGFPVGLAAYKAADLDSIKIVVGVLITAFALLLIVREWRLSRAASAGFAVEEFKPQLLSELAIGFISGVMAVALAMPGPVVVLYLLARHVRKQISRAATLLLFGFSYGSVSLVHTVWGGMTGETWLLAAKLTPFVIGGAFLGHYVTRYLSEERFRAVVLLILIASGAYGVWTAL